MQGEVGAKTRYSASRSNSLISSNDAFSKCDIERNVEVLLSLIDERLHSEEGRSSRSKSSNPQSTNFQEASQFESGLPRALFTLLDQDDTVPIKGYTRKMNIAPHRSVPNISSVLEIDDEVVSPRSRRLKAMANMYRSVPDLSSALELPFDNAPILPRRRLSSDPDLFPATDTPHEDRRRRRSGKSNAALPGKRIEVFTPENRNPGRISVKGKLITFPNLDDDETLHSDLTKTDQEDDSDEGSQKGYRSYKMSLAGPRKYTRKLPQENHPLKQEMWPKKALSDQSLSQNKAHLQQERWLNPSHSCFMSPCDGKQQPYKRRSKSFGEGNDTVVLNIAQLRTPRDSSRDESIIEFCTPHPAAPGERRWSEKEINLRWKGSDVLRTQRLGECGAHIPDQQDTEKAQFHSAKARLQNDSQKQSILAGMSSSARSKAIPLQGTKRNLTQTMAAFDCPPL